MEHLSRIVGDNLRRLRSEKGLSLEAVARLSGVSKSMLGQIERGEANPTISTAWRIANGLKVSFTALVSRPSLESELVVRDEVEPLVEDGGRCRTYPAFPFDAALGFETYAVEIDPGGYLQADGHTPGSQELLTLTAGLLTVRAGEQEHALAPGDSLRFKADGPHAYHNTGRELAVFTLVIAYPRD